VITAAAATTAKAVDPTATTVDAEKEEE